MWCFVAASKKDKVLCHVELSRAEVPTLPTAYPTKMMALSGAWVARTVDITKRPEYFQMISSVTILPKTICRSVNDVCKICTVYVCNPPSTMFLNVFKDGSGGLQKGSCVLEDEKRGERKQSTDLMKCRMRLSFGFTVYCQPTQEVCHRPQMSVHAWNETNILLKASAPIIRLLVHSKEALYFSKFEPFPDSPTQFSVVSEAIWGEYVELGENDNCRKVLEAPNLPSLQACWGVPDGQMVSPKPRRFDMYLSIFVNALKRRMSRWDVWRM